VEECGPCPVYASFTLAFALQLRKKARKNLNQGKKDLSRVNKNLSQCTVYILPKHPHITKPTHTYTYTQTHTHKHTHIHTQTHTQNTHKHTNTHTHTPTNTHKHTHPQTHKNTTTQTHTNTHTHIHTQNTQTHTYTHKHTHKHIQTQPHTHTHTLYPQFILYIRRPRRATSIQIWHYHACYIIQDNTLKITEVLVSQSSIFSTFHKKKFFKMNFLNSVSVHENCVQLKCRILYSLPLRSNIEMKRSNNQCSHQEMHLVQFTTIIVTATCFNRGVTF